MVYVLQTYYIYGSTIDHWLEQIMECLCRFRVCQYNADNDTNTDDDNYGSNNKTE